MRAADQNGDEVWAVEGDDAPGWYVILTLNNQPQRHRLDCPWSQSNNGTAPGYVDFAFDLLRHEKIIQAEGRIRTGSPRSIQRNKQKARERVDKAFKRVTTYYLILPEVVAQS
jgi:hypothetical protein